MPAPNTLAKFVRNRRLALGLSQEKLASNSDLSLGVVRKAECDPNYDPPQSTLRKLALGLRVPIGHLVRVKRPARRT